MIHKILITAAFLLLSTFSFAQYYGEYHLRLEPVWSRVADVYGELGSVESAEFSPDGRYIVSGTKFDNSVVMWRTSDGFELWRQYTKLEIERVGWSSNGKYVAAASEDFLVTVYEAATGEVVKKLKHENGIDGLTWSHAGNLLVSGEEAAKGIGEAYIRVYDMDNDEEVKNINFGATVNELFFTADDKYLLATGHGSIKVYDTSNWSVVQTLVNEENPKATFISGVFSPDGTKVFATCRPGDLFMWDWKSGRLLRKFNHTGKKVESVAWHPNGRYLTLVGHDSYIRVYRVEQVLKYKNDRIPVAHKIWAGDHAEYIDFNADGSFVVSAHQNGLIKLWAWMGEDPDVNDKRHSMVKREQSEFSIKAKQN